MVGRLLSAKMTRAAGRAAVIIGAAATLGACAQFSGTATKFSPSDYGVAASERVVNRGRIPVGGGYEHTGNPYVVAGQLYVPREEPDYSETGLASWYGANFHGRQTANGETYDMNRLTAAHPTLPLPSYVRVTNLENGASIVVRVNDRGPFHDGRIIDLSAQAAEVLGMTVAGIARVQVDYIGRASLEGNDTRMLMATYQAPGRQNTATVAYDAGSRTVATSTRRGLFSQFGDQAAAAVYQPAALTANEDPLGDLLGATIRTYAALPSITPAQEAAELLAAGNAGQAFANHVVIQVGVFGERENANRIAIECTGYGTVTVTEIEGENGPMWSVRVTTDARYRQAAIDAAAAAGAIGAYALN